MNFEEQPTFTLNKAIKYGAILLSFIFIFLTLKFKKITPKEMCSDHSLNIILLSIIKGFFISIFASLPIIILLHIFDIRIFNFNMNDIDNVFFVTILLSVLSGLIIGFIEEFFFRGIMVRENNFTLNNLFSIILASASYSTFHFIKIPDILDPVIAWDTGLTYLIDVFTNLNNLILYDAFYTLLIFGIFLSLVKIRYKNIFYCIGIHAGFIFVIKTYKQNSYVNFEGSFLNLISPYDHFIGHMVSLTILTYLLIFIFNAWLKNR
jgi:membrane protease YdiL (CAAX protease family)